MFDWPTFVLQRRINEPLAAVEQVVCDPTALRAGTIFDLGADGVVARLDAPFGVTFPPFGLDGASWVAPASAVSRRGRIRMRFVLEINAWDQNSTELLLRPLARHPYRWGGRRLRQYFRLAHSTADALTQLLGSRAAFRVVPTDRRTPILIV